MTYVDDLLAAMKALFVQLFEPFLTGFVASLHKKVGEVGSATDWNFAKAFEGWDKMFDKLLKGLEDKASQDRKSRLRTTTTRAIEPTTPPSENDSSTEPSIPTDAPQDEQQIARNVQALKNRLRGRGRGRGGASGGGRVRTESGSGKDSLPGSE